MEQILYLRDLARLASEIETCEQNANHYLDLANECEAEREQLQERFETLWSEFCLANQLQVRKLSKNSEFPQGFPPERGPAEGELDHAARKQNAHDLAELDARNANARDGRG